MTTTTQRRPRSWHAAAKHRWPRALWIAGGPPVAGPCFAVVSDCPRGQTLTLWGTRDEAEKTKKAIDETACGGMCCRRHRVVEMKLT